jgi:lipopolysaccharide/colanic/teichoic acid biosynthesis glycosyltransferase
MSKKPSSWYRFSKRITDLFLSLFLLLFLSPLFLAITIWVFIASPGNPFFCQKRFGRDGNVFICFKFRTMTKDAPHNLPASQFVEPWRYFIKGGGFLRRLGLDELPQLFNILGGQMSFVGPRPVILEESLLEEARRKNGAISFRPGLTGYAQIKNRSCSSSSEKAALDGFYASNASIRLDWLIFWGTFKTIFHKKK